MFLRFAFCFISRHFCSWNLSITAANNAWGGFSLGRGVMECKKEVVRMMVRNGAVLMRGREKGGRQTKKGIDRCGCRFSKGFGWLLKFFRYASNLAK